MKALHKRPVRSWLKTGRLKVRALTREEPAILRASVRGLEVSPGDLQKKDAEEKVQPKKQATQGEADEGEASPSRTQ